MKIKSREVPLHVPKMKPRSQSYEPTNIFKLASFFCVFSPPIQSFLLVITAGRRWFNQRSLNKFPYCSLFVFIIIVSVMLLLTIFTWGRSQFNLKSSWELFQGFDSMLSLSALSSCPLLWSLKSEPLKLVAGAGLLKVSLSLPHSSFSLWVWHKRLNLWMARIARC